MVDDDDPSISTTMGDVGCVYEISIWDVADDVVPATVVAVVAGSLLDAGVGVVQADGNHVLRAGGVVLAGHRQREQPACQIIPGE